MSAGWDAEGGRAARRWILTLLTLLFVSEATIAAEPPASIHLEPGAELTYRVSFDTETTMTLYGRPAGSQSNQSRLDVEVDVLEPEEGGTLRLRCRIVRVRGKAHLPGRDPLAFDSDDRVVGFEEDVQLGTYFQWHGVEAIARFSPTGECLGIDEFDFEEDVLLGTYFQWHGVEAIARFSPTGECLGIDEFDFEEHLAACLADVSEEARRELEAHLRSSASEDGLRDLLQLLVQPLPDADEPRVDRIAIFGQHQAAQQELVVECAFPEIPGATPPVRDGSKVTVEGKVQLRHPEAALEVFDMELLTGEVTGTTVLHPEHGTVLRRRLEASSRTRIARGSAKMTQHVTVMLGRHRPPPEPEGK